MQIGRYHVNNLCSILCENGRSLYTNENEMNRALGHLCAHIG